MLADGPPTAAQIPMRPTVTAFRRAANAVTAWPHLWPLAVSLLLDAVFTWPLLLHMGGSFMSLEYWYGGDPNILIWFADRLAHLGDSNALPLGLMLYWPHGLNSFAGYDGLLVAILALPVAILGRPVLGYNLAVLLGLWLNAAATYWLVWRQTSSRFAATFGGLIFGFSTYAIIRSFYHANLSMVFGLPLILLAAQAWVRRPTAGRGLAIGGALLLAGLSSLHYLIIGGLMLAIFAATEWRTVITSPRAAAWATACCLVAALCVSLPLYLNRPPERPTSPAVQQQAFSLYWPNLLLPHPLTDVFAPLTFEAYAGFPSAEGRGIPNEIASTGYLGLPLIALALLGILTLRRQGHGREALTWLAVAMVPLTLAFGPAATLFGSRLPLPYALLEWLPPFAQLREPVRLFLPALLGGTMLAGPALVEIRNQLARKKYALAAFAILLAALLFAERLAVPVPLVTKRVSPFYAALAAQPDRFALAELPIGYLESAGSPATADARLAMFSEYDYFQMTHGKPIVDGEYFYTAFALGTFEYINAVPLLRFSVCRAGEIALPTTVDRAASLRKLVAADVRFVVVHNLTLFDYPQCASTLKYIRRFFADEKPYYTDGEITVYGITATADHLLSNVETGPSR